MLSRSGRARFLYGLGCQIEAVCCAAQALGDKGEKPPECKQQ